MKTIQTANGLWFHSNWSAITMELVTMRRHARS